MRSKPPPADSKPSFIEEARRRQIIEAAIAAVAEEGYAGASLGRVAQRAQISKSVVVYYFGGKDKLVEATVHQIYDEIWSFVGPRLRAETTARGQLRAYIESEFAFLEGHRERLVAMGCLVANHRNAAGAAYLLKEAQRINLETMGGMLEAGQKAGEFRAFAVRPMAATLMHAINGALSQWAADPKLSLSDYAREIATIFDLATRRRP